MTTKPFSQAVCTVRKSLLVKPLVVARAVGVERVRLLAHEAAKPHRVARALESSHMREFSLRDPKCYYQTRTAMHTYGG